MTGGSGSATNAGINYQQRVSASFLALMLTDTAASILLNNCLFDKKIEMLAFEGRCPIDDLVATYDDNSRAYIQIKRSLSMSESKESDFFKTIDQFVKQFLSSKLVSESYISITTSYSSAKITRELKKILDCIRLNDVSFMDNPLNISEKDTLNKFHKIVRKIFRIYAKRDMRDDEFIDFSKRIFILMLEPESGYSLEASILALLVSKNYNRPTDLWNTLISDCLTFATNRASVKKQNIQEKYANFIAQENQTEDTDRLFNIKIMANIATGKEVILVEQNETLKALNDTADYFILELFRFDDHCNKKVIFTQESCILLSGHKLKVLHRTSSMDRMEKLLSSDNFLNGTSIAIVPANEIDYVESSECAQLHRNKCNSLFNNNSNKLVCIECGKAISTNDALVAEIDQNDRSNKIGLIHKECLRATIRVLGVMDFELFQKFPTLKNFDWQLWIEQLRNGQYVFGGNVNIVNRIKVILWNSTVDYEEYDYCIRLDLEDGSCEYVKRRGKLDRFKKNDAESEIVNFENTKLKIELQNDFLCYTKKERIFTKYSVIKNSLGIDDKAIKVVGFLIEKINTYILQSTNKADNFYAPLFYIRVGIDQDFFCIADRVILLSSPILFSNFIENWSDAGYWNNFEYETVVIADDKQFDAFMFSVMKHKLKAVVDPQFDKNGEMLNGYLIEEYDDAKKCLA